MSRLGAGAGKPDPFCRWDKAADALRPLQLELVRGSVVRAARQLGHHSLDHGRVAVAEQQRAMASDVVDVLISVHVPLARSGRARHEWRVRLEVAAYMGDAVGEQADSAGMKPGRARRLFG